MAENRWSRGRAAPEYVLSAGGARARGRSGGKRRGGPSAALLSACLVGQIASSACASESSCDETKTCAAPGNGNANGGNGGSATSGATGGVTGAAGTGGGAIGAGGANSGGASGVTGGDAGAGGGAGAEAIDGGEDASARDGARDAPAPKEAGPDCDGSALHAVAGCTIDDPTGLYVSLGADGTSANGSRAYPYPSIARAVTAAASDAGQRTKIYVCGDAGPYAEALKLDATRDGLSFFGGFRCADWTYDPKLKTRLSPAATTALTASGLKKGLTVEDFAIGSADATAPGTSSIAVLVNGAVNVALRRTTITAGRGADGLRGANGNPGPDGDAPIADQNGLPAVCTSPPSGQYGGSLAGVPHCGAYSGPGPGGEAYLNANGGAGFYGTPQTDVTPPNVDDGVAGSTVLGQNAATGGDGSRGNDGALGTKAAVAGAFSASGFTSADGAGGTDGFPGQGGGGGGASRGSASCCGASGGGGGVQGCGGHHGVGGTGGGASVALYVWSSAVTLDTVTLIAVNGGSGGAGGNGGAGGKGQPGGTGGKGAATNNIGAGGGGGKGGDGGTGGSGSGGTGGPSYALVYHGTPPTRAGVTLTPGQPGLKGAGGSATNASGLVRAPDGTDGEAASEHVVP